MNKSTQNLHKIIATRLAQAKRHHVAGRLREAETIFSQLLKEFGNNPSAVLACAEAAVDLGETDAALSLFQRADRLAPNDLRILGPYGTFLARSGKTDEAIVLLKRAILQAPADAQLHYNLGKSLALQGKTAQAADAYRQACLHDPKFAWALTNLGNALSDMGRHDEAAKAYRQALALNPHDATCWSNHLLSSQYAEGATAASLFALSQGFEDAIGKPLKKVWKAPDNSPDPERRLRIGFVSPDLRRHPVGYFMQGVFAHHDQSSFEFHVYSNRLKEDDLTERLRRSVKSWTDISAMDDKNAAQRIRSDQIDILIDLAGHTGNGRLALFARKPAPIQVAWCGYVGTTGLQAMDAIVADRFHIPEGEEGFYVERVLRLPDSWLCYTPPEQDLPVVPPPLLKNNHVTFGCFNNPAKISPSTMRLWQRILDAVPLSRLRLCAGFFINDERIDIYRQRFAEVGADMSRIDFHPALAQQELLASYGEIDIALDPFPYSGGITTLEALWMGVPVVTKTGASFPGRHSTSFLTTAGLGELVAQDDADYLNLAVALATAPERLQTLRLSLRQRLLSSPLLDHVGFTRNFETSLRRLWRDRCVKR